ncbi:hypothetical protein MRX96_037241 [Rhipicephalus microplus]
MKPCSHNILVRPLGPTRRFYKERSGMHGTVPKNNLSLLLMFFFSLGRSYANRKWRIKGGASQRSGHSDGACWHRTHKRARVRTRTCSSIEPALHVYTETAAELCASAPVVTAAGRPREDAGYAIVRGSSRCKGFATIAASVTPEQRRRSTGVTSCSSVEADSGKNSVTAVHTCHLYELCGEHLARTPTSTTLLKSCGIRNNEQQPPERSVAAINPIPIA